MKLLKPGSGFAFSCLYIVTDQNQEERVFKLVDAITVRMGFLAFGRPKRFVLVFWVGIIFMLTITVGRVAADDQTGVPETGLLCISDCSTCPVICSPPPPPGTKGYSYPPLSPPPPPPGTKGYSYPPLSPPPVHHSPPESYYQSPPPRPTTPSPQTAPPWTWTTSPATPPPPFKYNNNAPPSQGQARAPPTAGIGSNSYPYPYYYFYASDASPLSSHASFSILVFLCSVLLLLCCR